MKIEFNEIRTWGDGLATGQLFVTGVALLVIFASSFVSTMERIRRTTLGFRLFWWTHVVGITLAFPLLIIHGTILGVPILLYFCALPMGLYMLDCFVRRVKVAKFKARVVCLRTHEANKDDRVVQLVVSNPKYVYQPGQYAEINIPTISKSEWHPFTIASAPISGKGKGAGEVEFFIKACGKWTENLYELASRCPGNVYANGTKVIPEIGIRGPFGAPAQNYFDYQHIICIGSGIGVTPVLSIWKHLVRKSSSVVDPELAHPSFDGKKKETKKGAGRFPKNFDEKRLLESANIDFVDVTAFEGKSLSSGRAQAAFYASLFESMTVNICLLVFSLGMETIVFCLWLYKVKTIPAMLQVSKLSEETDLNTRWQFYFMVFFCAHACACALI